jgi:hypothetical protein
MIRGEKQHHFGPPADHDGVAITGLCRASGLDLAGKR